MTITFAGVEFDRVSYDRDADVLYLNVDGSEPMFWEETPGGHVLRFDCFRELCGATIIGVRRHLDADGRVDITIPRREELGSAELDAALA
jgi:uncharacterized protein YuzE